MASRFLDAAELLLDHSPRSAAFRRRAVSNAYYGLFHALAKACTAALLPTQAPESPEYVRLYRALEHGSAFSAFRDGALSKPEDLKRIAELFVALKTQREIADYMPPDPALFRLEEVREIIAQAREGVAAVERLRSDQKQFLAAFLLVKSGRR